MRSQLLLVPAALVLASGTAAALNFQTLESGQARIFPGARFAPVDFTLTDAQVEALRKVYGVPVKHRQIKAWRVSTGGWLFLDQVFGLDDTISYLVGISPQATVVGVEILVCVQGFCDIATPEWKSQFVGRREGKWVPQSEIRNISGSTLSAMHVAEGVKKTLAIHARFMPRR
jgi:hypothetical protein